MNLLQVHSGLALIAACFSGIGVMSSLDADFSLIDVVYLFFGMFAFIYLILASLVFGVYFLAIGF